MPDWRRLVVERLALLALDEEERAAVVEELAGHLEEEVQRLLRQGLPESAAAFLALDRVGDRWTLLVIRDLLGGARRFTDLMDRLGGITPKTLSQRLRDLEDDGLVEDDGGAGPNAGTGTGHGLLGLRERVEVFHGTLDAAPRPDGGFRLRVALPTGDEP